MSLRCSVASGVLDAPTFVAAIAPVGFVDGVPTVLTDPAVVAPPVPRFADERVSDRRRVEPEKHDLFPVAILAPVLLEFCREPVGQFVLGYLETGVEVDAVFPAQ